MRSQLSIGAQAAAKAQELFEEWCWMAGHLAQAAASAAKAVAWLDGRSGIGRLNEKLASCVACGDEAGAREALRAGADPHEALEAWGRACWRWSAGGAEECLAPVRAALEAGADPNRPIESVGGRGLVAEALYLRHWGVASAGLAFGGEDDGLDPDELFGCISGVRFSREGLRVWIELGFDVDWRTREGDSLLLRAADCGDLEGIGQLLDAGANPNLGDGWGRRPLGAAARICEKGRGDCAGRRAAAKLLAAGADPWAGAEEACGFCALAYAVAADSVGMVDDLLAAMDPASAPGGSRRREEVARALAEARMRGDFGVDETATAKRIEAWLLAAEDFEAVEEACGPSGEDRSGALRL